MKTNHKIDFLLGILVGGLIVTYFLSKELIKTHDYYSSKIPSTAREWTKIGCMFALNKNQPLLAEEVALCDKIATDKTKMFERIWKDDLPEDF